MSIKNKLIFAMFALTSMVSQVTSAQNEGWYGVHTLNEYSSKGCEVVKTIDLVTDLKGGTGNRQLSNLDDDFEKSIVALKKKAQEIKANVILGTRFELSYATLGDVSTINPHNWVVYAYGTAAVIRCGK